MKLFVTGGTGFLGTRLLKRIVSEGHQVWGLARSEEGAQRLRKQGVTPVIGSLENIHQWESALDGMDSVIHCASIIETWGEWKVFYSQITQATDTLLQTSARQKVTRFIYISSESVMQSRDPLLDVDESYLCNATPNSYYGHAKLLAEQAILRYSGNMHCIILRPTFIYGPGDNFSSILQEMLAANKFTWVDAGKHVIERVHVDNVVEAITLSLQNGQDKGIYLITDRAPATARQLFSERALQLGIALPEKNVPSPLAKTAAATMEWIWRTFRLKGKPPLTRFEVAFVAMPRRYCIDRAVTDLGYQPRKQTISECEKNTHSDTQHKTR